VRDALYAFRTFRRAPLAALTIVATVALGLGLVAAAFTILNVVVFRVDEVRNPGELFGVEYPRSAQGDRVRLTRPQYEALRRETAVFTDAFAMLPDIDTRVDGRTMSTTLVTGNFFDVLGVRPVRGRALTPADDERSTPIVVLSDRGWTRKFSRDPGVIGRALSVNGMSFEIVGIMPAGFRGLDVAAPDLWAPMSHLAQFRPMHRGHEDSVGVDVVGRLKPGLSARTALAGLLVWDSGRPDGAAIDRRAAALTLEPRNGTIAQPIETLIVFTPIFLAFGLILLIGCTNVANLLLARGLSRQREIGVRLSLGASRARIVRQLLTENLLLALASAAVAYLISRLALEGTVYAVTSTLAPELAETVNLIVPPADWRVALFLVIGAVAATALFGLAPALHAARLELVRTMRGEVAMDSRPGRVRNLLIGLQVTASAVLLICSAVFLRSAFASANVDPGFRTADTVIVQVGDEETRVGLIGALKSESSVAAISATWPDPLDRPRAALAEVNGARSAVAYRFVSPDYFGVLDIAVVRGRGFTASERRANASVAVVAESVARQLWPSGDALGQLMRLERDANADPGNNDEPPLPVRSVTIVGIAEDLPGFRFAPYKEAGVYLPASETDPKTALMLRVHGDPEVARLALVKRLTAIDPGMGQIITMRTLATMETYFLQLAFWVTLVLGGFALALTLSGLFSILSYLVEQRRKEIGVRMALGATTRNVTALVLAQTLRPVGFGLAAGVVLAAALGVALMATPAAAQIAQSIRIFDPVAYVVSVLCIASACASAAAIPASRASRVDPIAALRQD
jgi:putative ABC transport system permease protein